MSSDPAEQLYAPPERVSAGSLVPSFEAYQAMYQRVRACVTLYPSVFVRSRCLWPRSVRARSLQSIKESDAFWTEQATSLLNWDVPFSAVTGGSFSKGDIRWFSGGKLNVSVNCLDRHIPTIGSQVRRVGCAQPPRWRFGLFRPISPH